VGPENTAANEAGLFAVILMSGPASGGHFNPVVSFAGAAFGGAAAARRGRVSARPGDGRHRRRGRGQPDVLSAAVSISVKQRAGFISAEIIGGPPAVAVIRVLYPGVTPAQAVAVIVPPDVTAPRAGEIAG
jgi:glycerol uptake facilitator-like aquaporin